MFKIGQKVEVLPHWLTDNIGTHGYILEDTSSVCLDDYLLHWVNVWNGKCYEKMLINEKYLKEMKQE
jgi:hypothetical protein